MVHLVGFYYKNLSNVSAVSMYGWITDNFVGLPSSRLVVCGGLWGTKLNVF